MEYFAAVFCKFLTKNHQIWLLCRRLGTRHRIQAFQGFSFFLVRAQRPAQRDSLEIS